MSQEGGSVESVGRLLSKHSVKYILRWLDNWNKQDKRTGRCSGGEPSWEEFQHLRPHFATTFTDFLLIEAKYVMDSEADAETQRHQKSSSRSAEPVGTPVRRATPQNTHSGSASRHRTPGSGDGKSGGLTGSRTPGSSEGKRGHRGRGSTPRNSEGKGDAARTEWRDSGRSRHVPLTELVVTRRPRRHAKEEPAAPATPQKQLMRRSPERQPTVLFQPAEPRLVTDRLKLDGLALLYGYLINRHHLLGLSIELNFLVRLLVAPGKQDASAISEDSAIFLTSVHNAVYLATATLWQVRHHLCCLDAANLRLLATNDRLVRFRPDLAEALLSLLPSDGRQAAPPVAQNEQDGLMFHPELVCRDSFPSDATFHAFRRQQDLFHSLVARWNSQQSGAMDPGGGGPGWLAEGARALISLCAHPVNMHQLSRLFLAQLLQLAEPSAAANAAEQPADMLEQADRLRLLRLDDRFLRPTLSGRAGGRRHFPGAEELFRQLLLTADSAAFAAALRHLLADSLLTLDVDDLTEADAQQVSARIFRLRLLAKFLGVATFGGLHCAEPVPAPLLSRCVQQRGRLPPPLDLLACLRAALRARRLVVTLPWVVEYLCMMDAVSVLTSAHQTVFSLLVRLRGTLSHAPPGLAPRNALFLRLLYENLYEIHWHVQNLYDKDDAAAIDAEVVSAISGEFSRIYWSGGDAGSEEAGAGDGREDVDSRDVVRPGLVYACCPALQDQRLALLRYRAGRPHQPSPAVRKIMPISAQSPAKTDNITLRTQTELREAFFQSHQPSLRRTAAFVVERIASTQLRLMRARLLPAEMRPLAAPLRPMITARLAAGQPQHQVKSWLESRLADVALRHHAALVSGLAAAARRRAAPPVRQALEALLCGEQLTPGARHACTQLVEAGVSSRVNVWLNANLTRNFLQHLLGEECRSAFKEAKQAESALTTELRTRTDTCSAEDVECNTPAKRPTTRGGHTETDEEAVAGEHGPESGTLSRVGRLSNGAVSRLDDKIEEGDKGSFSDLDMPNNSSVSVTKLSKLASSIDKAHSPTSRRNGNGLSVKRKPRRILLNKEEHAQSYDSSRASEELSVGKGLGFALVPESSPLKGDSRSLLNGFHEISESQDRLQSSGNRRSRGRTVRERHESYTYREPRGDPRQESDRNPYCKERQVGSDLNETVDGVTFLGQAFIPLGRATGLGLERRHTYLGVEMESTIASNLVEQERSGMRIMEEMSESGNAYAASSKSLENSVNQQDSTSDHPRTDHWGWPKQDHVTCDSDGSAEEENAILDLPISDTELQSPSACLIQLKTLLCELLTGCEVTSEGVSAALEPVPEVLNQWNRLLPSSAAGVKTLCDQLLATLESLDCQSMLTSRVQHQLTDLRSQLQLIDLC